MWSIKVRSGPHSVSPDFVNKTRCGAGFSPLCGYYLFLFAKQDVSMKGTVWWIIKGAKQKERRLQSPLPAIPSACLFIRAELQASLLNGFIHDD